MRNLIWKIQSLFEDDATWGHDAASPKTQIWKSSYFYSIQDDLVPKGLQTSTSFPIEPLVFRFAERIS